ncbi:hypothetical protein MMC21_007299 [Puttea exsequens]|nr:hypothetical protein [Puttea exsequens]
MTNTLPAADPFPTAPIELQQCSVDAIVESQAKSRRGGVGNSAPSAVGGELLDGGRDTTPPAAAINTKNHANANYAEKAKLWWQGNVSLVLDHTSRGIDGGGPKDYLALERTFLSWVRTASVIVSTGVVVSQLFILKDLDPTKGKILGSLLAGGGVITNLVGCERYFRQQRLLVHGKVLVGGWHHEVMLALLIAIFLTLFVVVLVEV